MLPVYVKNCLSRKAVHWTNPLSQGRASITDKVRPCRPVESATEKSAWRLERMIQADRQITVDRVEVLGLIRYLQLLDSFHFLPHPNITFEKIHNMIGSIANNL